MAFQTTYAPMGVFALPSWVVRALSVRRHLMYAVSMPIDCR